MSSESSELSPKMFIEDPESRAKPYQKGYFILKRELIGKYFVIFPSKYRPNSNIFLECYLMARLKD